ncbi:MAG: transcriptional regulator, partial [Chlorobiaceae bacterium]|nr:transcriptional regulator [Chlorobiaceae bacterium]
MRLQITDKNHWHKNHPEDGYIKRLNVINGSIVHSWIESDHDITLNSIDDDLLLQILNETGLGLRPFHVVMDLAHVREVTSSYKHSIANLLYNWKPPLRTVGLYNVCIPIRILVESLASVVPQNVQFIIADTYEEIVEKVLSGRNDLHVLEGKSDEDQIKHRFLESVAKLTWLNMLDEPVPVPPFDNKYYPYFRAIDEIRSDLVSRETEKKMQMLEIKKEFENRIGHLNIKMNAQTELNKKTTQNQEKQIWELKAIIASHETELSRVAGSLNEKMTALRKLLEHIQHIEIDSRQKKKMQNLCQKHLETEAIEKNLQNDLPVPESSFLNVLQNRHPGLTQRELKICLLVRQNYDTDEISRSLEITKRGME